jgi:DNA adenine methylase
MKPIIKWVGGKHRLINELSNNLFIAEGKTYYEPFVGGGSLFLHIQPKKWVINDTNRNLINLWTKIRDEPEELCRNLDILIEEYRTSNDKKEIYYNKRNKYNENIRNNVCETSVHAALFIFLNKTCFNGLYRVNSSGFFNVPWNKNEDPFFVDNDMIKKISIFMNGTEGQIRCLGWKESIYDVEKDDFVYFDPPYYPQNKTSFTTYTTDVFHTDEHEDMAREIHELDSRDVLFMLSNSNVEKVREMYSKFSISPVSLSRSISCKKNSRGKKDCELIITNYLKI